MSHNTPAVVGHLDPSIQGFVHKLSAKQPSFNVPTENINIMHQPTEFYQCLLVGTLSGRGRHSDSYFCIGHDNAR